mmetsp:Transcript_23711/g.42390  ORF Transcript_23711/g.42390 Transcript_23711/m.42390 type:complete len:346 (-) Transcript_23711:96-1133(-)
MPAHMWSFSSEFPLPTSHLFVSASSSSCSSTSTKHSTVSSASSQTSSSTSWAGSINARCAAAAAVAAASAASASGGAARAFVAAGPPGKLPSWSSKESLGRGQLPWRRSGAVQPSDRSGGGPAFAMLAMAVGAALGGSVRTKTAQALAGAGPRTNRRTSATSRAAAEFPSPFFFLEELKRKSLKEELLAALKDSNRGVETTVEQRAVIEKLIDELSAVNPTAVAGSRLTGRWQLLWTTEKETLALTGGGFLGRPVSDVFQRIDAEAGTLSNNIEFEDGAFEVDSTCEPSDGIRVDFQFTSARLRFSGFTLPLPPVGKGWFDCVYLDDELRIVRDSRDDILIALQQ